MDGWATCGTAANSISGGGGIAGSSSWPAGSEVSDGGAM